jgi:hypothetical protein
MSGFTSLSQNAYSALTTVRGNTRILEAEMRLDASRGITIPRKQENLEKLKQQEEAALNQLGSAITQESENTQKFIDSIEETNNRIREEAEIAAAEKEAEEKAAEESSSTEKGTETTEKGQSTGESNTTTDAVGKIVDIVIPETVITTGLPESSNSEAPKEAVGNVVNVSA